MHIRWISWECSYWTHCVAVPSGAAQNVVSFLPQQSQYAAWRRKGLFTPDALHYDAHCDTPQHVQYKQTFRPTFSGSHSVSVNGLHGPGQFLLTVVCWLPSMLTGMCVRVRACAHMLSLLAHNSWQDVAGEAVPLNGRLESAVVMRLSETATLQVHHFGLVLGVSIESQDWPMESRKRDFHVINIPMWPSG